MMYLQDRLKSEVLALLSDVPESQYAEKMVGVSEHVSQEVNKELVTLGYPALDGDLLVSTVTVSFSRPSLIAFK